VTARQEPTKIPFTPQGLDRVADSVVVVANELDELKRRLDALEQQRGSE
jgi:hypothetical protein